jgi:hypothetical protein
VRSHLRPRTGRPASADSIPATGRSRVMRGAAHGALLLALVGGTGAYAAAQGSPGDILPSAVPSDVAASLDARAAREADAASRSEARTAPVTVQLTADGTTTSVITRAETVADLLAEHGVALGADDEVSVPLDSAPADGSEVAVSRVTFTDVTESKELPFGTREQPDGSLESGKRAVASEGKAGSERVVYRARLVDGVEVSREEVLRSGVAPVEKVVRVGTKAPAPAPAPARSSSSSSSSAPSGSYSGADPRSIGRSMAAARGWGADQFSCLDRLWTKESNWNPYAQNPSSGAYGIPQALPGSKMGTVAGDWRTNPSTQIAWGLNYIAGRYGTPCSAWSHSQAVNWY